MALWYSISTNSVRALKYGLLNSLESLTFHSSSINEGGLRFEGGSLSLLDSWSAVDRDADFKAVLLPANSNKEAPSGRGFLLELLSVVLVSWKKLRMLFCAILLHVAVFVLSRNLLSPCAAVDKLATIKI